MTGVIYMAFDDKGETIYIGLASQDWVPRVVDHERDYWWKKAVWFEVFRFPTYARASLVETPLIRALRPRHNAKSNPDYHYRPAMPRGRQKC